MRSEFALFVAVRRLRGGQLVCLLAAWTAAVNCLAAPPLEPLPLPGFSFDRSSPSVAGGIVGASDILTVEAEEPASDVFGNMLGLPLPGDDLDALSGANAYVTTQTFVLLFSVDRDTAGAVPPAQQLIDLDVPYNVWDQAQRGHAAGDQYLATTLFSRIDGPKRGGQRPPNNTLDRNNYDEGGTDFGAQPATGARGQTGGSNEDNVDGTGSVGGGPKQNTIANVYFSVTSDSPSLATLPGATEPSGAHIFFNPQPSEFAPTELYAGYYDLGLAENDDIDALIVFDIDENGRFNGDDQVLFSLTPDSPSLTTIPGASDEGAAADVFVVIPGYGPQLFTAAIELGLGAPYDNVDALEFTFCDSPLQCAAWHGIRALRGDLNCDDLVNTFDIDPFVLALTDEAAYHAAFPNCQHYLADCNYDGNVNTFDIDLFVALLLAH